MYHFSSKMDNFDFFSPNLPKNRFWRWNFKSLSPYFDSAPPRYYVYQLSVKTNKFEFFGLNLGKLPKYVQYFSSYNVGGVAESWVETEMSRVKVDGAGWRWLLCLAILFN